MKKNSVINHCLCFALLACGAAIVNGQTLPTPAAKDCAAELERTKERLTRDEARLQDWAQLNRYREANAKILPPAKDERRVVFLGDSITDYWSQPNRSDGFFPGEPYINRGISGQTTPQRLVRFYSDVIALNPRAVVILAGTNDIAGKTGKMTVAEIGSNLATMCDLARAHNIHAILASVLPVNDDGRDRNGKPLTAVTKSRPPTQIVELNDWIKSYAAANNLIYLDYFSRMVDERSLLKKDLSDDGLHPNPKGYAVTKPLAAAAIKTALDEQRINSFSGANEDSTISETALLKKMPQDILTRIGAGGRPDKDGLVGHNKGHWYEAGMQRGAMQMLVIAAVQGDANTAEDAWRAIDAAFARQTVEGDFETSDLPEAKHPHTYADRVGTTAFWLQEMSHALLVVKASTLEPRFRERISNLLPKVRRAYAFLSDGARVLEQKDSKATNRLLISAKAFGLGGVLLDDANLKRIAAHFVDISLAKQTADGVFLENGGADTSYHAVSLLMLQIYAVYLGNDKINDAIKRGMSWELARIKPSGEVEVAGNTRTGLGQEVYFGKAKRVNYNEVALALFYYGARFNDARVLQIGAQVFAFDHQNRR